MADDEKLYYVSTATPDMFRFLIRLVADIDGEGWLLMTRGHRVMPTSLVWAAHTASTKDAGIGAAGDAVAVILPMSVSSIAAYLGIILAGCVVCPIADSFAAAEISVRLHIAAVRLVVTQVYFPVSTPIRESTTLIIQTCRHTAQAVCVCCLMD